MAIWPHFTLYSLAISAHQQLFQKVMKNKYHVLHQLLPPKQEQKYSLRPRRHNLQTEVLTNNSKKGFIKIMILNLL